MEQLLPLQLNVAKSENSPQASIEVAACLMVVELLGHGSHKVWLS